ncbi:leucine-rich repeat domain-containing protein [Legionella sp. D16C41]|uniref:leucine-rich repeat domain-containing protein n=1 Tax=Legionella sp. D16C41 TaxID=3402688 RepID=UPI003AF5B97C
MHLSEDKKIILKVANDEIDSKGTYSTPEAITAIESKAFYSCNHLKAITMPNVKLIGSWAFYDCINLKTVSMLNVTAIGPGAFTKCRGLEALFLSEKITAIGTYAFHNCLNLKNIIIDISDDSKLEYIKKLFPSYLRDKIIALDISGTRNTYLARILQTPQTNALFRFFNPNARHVAKVQLDKTNQQIEKESPKLIDDIFCLINSFLVNDNLYYAKVKQLIFKEPLPCNKAQFIAYKNKLETITQDCIDKAKECTQITGSITAFH